MPEQLLHRVTSSLYPKKGCVGTLAHVLEVIRKCVFRGFIHMD